MSDVVIKVENLSKQYRLGLIGGKTLRDDLHRWWAKWRGKPDPTLRVDQLLVNNCPLPGNNGPNAPNELDKPNAPNRSQSAPNNSESSAMRSAPCAMPSSSDDYVWALRDVSFEVKRGEILGIIGRNGAGKSTLLKILTRITAPTSGTAKMKGRVGALLEVGTGFHQELTGRENIYLSGAILGMTKTEVQKKLDEIVDFSGCEQYIDTPVKRYSSGMRVRLGFAVAAHLQPDILLVDEVLAVGDASFQKKCMGKMDEVAREGRTILFVSHNMNAINRLCTNSILLKDGQIVYFAETSTVVNYYLQRENHSLLSQMRFDGENHKAVQIIEASLFDGNHNILNGPILVSTKLYLKIKYKVNTLIRNLHLAFHLRNSQGDIVFFSDLRDTTQSYLFAEPGVYVFTINIPNPTLSPDFYTVSIGAVDKDSDFSEQKPDCLSFEIIDLENIRCDRPGFIFMPLQWHLNKEDNGR